MTRVRFRETDVPVASVTVATMEVTVATMANEPETPGVPLMIPVRELKPRPDGSAVTLQE